MVIKSIDALIADYAVFHTFVHIFDTKLAFELLAFLSPLKFWIWLCDKDTKYNHSYSD